MYDDEHAELHLEAAAIGRCAHTVIATVLAEGLEAERGCRVQQILRVTREVLADYPIKARVRAVLMECSTASATYLARFALPQGWYFLDSEIPLEGGRADIAYAHESDGRVLLDEIKTGRGRHGEARLRTQIDRYVLAGRERWGSRFVGVRLCAVSQPSRTRLFLPDRARSISANLSQALELLN